MSTAPPTRAGIVAALPALPGNLTYSELMAGTTTARVAESPSSEGRREQRREAAPDVLLLQRVAEGDEDALVVLFDTHRGRAFAIALRVLRDPYEAEDAVQETFIQVWRRPQAYDPARGEVGGWIRVIARTRALDRLRRLRPAQPSVRERAQPASRIDERLCMTQALEGLSVPQRQVIELSYYEGQTHAEIARSLGVPLGTVKGRLRTGMIRLRETLDTSVR